MDLRVEGLPRVRILPRPGQRLRGLVERASQVEAFAQRAAEGAREKLRPIFTRLYGAWRRLATTAVAVLTVWLFFHVMFGANGMVVYRQKRAEQQNLQREIDGLQKENDHYSGEIKALKTDPKTIEKEAREQLHYTRPGEVIYVAPVPGPAQPPASGAARK
jgi:cell division protein FtsB